MTNYPGKCLRSLGKVIYYVELFERLNSPVSCSPVFASNGIRAMCNRLMVISINSMDPSGDGNNNNNNGD